MVKDRAVILPTPADPFLLNYWINNYKKYWRDEVTHLYCVVNTPSKKYRDIVVELFDKKLEGGYSLILKDTQIEHGEAIRLALEEVSEKYVMLIEDDAYVFRQGAVASCFERLESGEVDILGSRRGSCSEEITKAAYEKWGLKDSDTEDSGANFWPCYFFTKTEILRSTSRRFGARAWSRGDTISPLCYVVEAPVVNGDTFVEASLELRTLVPEQRIAYIPQFHLHPDDEKHAYYSRGVFNGKSYWCHVGSLSSGVCGVIRDAYNVPLAYRGIKEREVSTKLESWANSEMERLEWCRRLSFWYRAYMTAEVDGGFETEELEAYGRGLAEICKQYNIPYKNVIRMIAMYSALGL